MDELKKVLSNTEHKNVKIGAENGSGFFYAGSIVNYLDNIERVDKACHLAAKQNVSRHKDRIDRMCRNCPTPEAFARRCLARDEQEKMTSENYSQFLDAYYKKLCSVSEETQKAEDILNNWKVLAQRKVVRCDDSIADEDCLVVIIEGYELGRYWTLDEVPKGEEVCFSLDEDEQNAA